MPVSVLPILRRQSTARAFFPHPREGFYAFAFCSSRDGKRDFGKCSALHDKQPQRISEAPALERDSDPLKGICSTITRTEMGARRD